MQKLLIMADDFTGALDTGIQFAKRGISTQVACGDGTDVLPLWEKARTQVLSVDMETRPMTAAEAYRAVYRLAKAAKELGISHIYKKTDSCLRGNVGAELLALKDAAGEPVCFLPAYPDAGRVTVEGTHYVNGVPLQDSAFGSDPFNPVMHSFIPDILKEGGDMKVSCIPAGGRIPGGEAAPCIYVLDAKSNEDIRDWAQVLKGQRRLHALAGCAGFAAYLPETLGLTEGERQALEKRERLYVACGSVNPVTERQVEYAAGQGFARIRLNPKQKLCPDYYETREGREFLENIYNICINNRGIVADTFDVVPGETKEYAKNHQIEESDIRRLIPACHGMILRYLMEKRVEQNYLLTGGDTLAGFLGLLPGYELHPADEASQGVVASRLMWRGRTEQIFTKSGGFGEKDVFVRLRNFYT